MEQTCTGCKETKSIDLFYKSATGKYGVRTYCKECERILYRDRKVRFPDTTKKKNASYYKNHQDEIKKYNAKYRLENKEKLHAHRIVHEALEKGNLYKLPCQKCGKIKVEGHHPDYTKPLEVIWLCRTHHRRIHVDND